MTGMLIEINQVFFMVHILMERVQERRWQRASEAAHVWRTSFSRKSRIVSRTRSNEITTVLGTIAVLVQCACMQYGPLK